MQHHPEWLWYLIAVLVIGTVAVSLAMDRANAGGHVRLAGNDWVIPAGDRTNATRHAWRPGAQDTIRVDVLVRRIEEERRPGRHVLTEDPPAVEERQADEDTGPRTGYYPLLTHPQPVLKLAA